MLVGLLDDGDHNNYGYDCFLSYKDFFKNSMESVITHILKWIVMNEDYRQSLKLLERYNFGRCFHFGENMKRKEKKGKEYILSILPLPRLNKQGGRWSRTHSAVVLKVKRFIWRKQSSSFLLFFSFFSFSSFVLFSLICLKIVNPGFLLFSFFFLLSYGGAFFSRLTE